MKSSFVSIFPQTSQLPVQVVGQSNENVEGITM
jgi:hypothetical protein